MVANERRARVSLGSSWPCASGDGLWVVIDVTAAGDGRMYIAELAGGDGSEARMAVGEAQVAQMAALTDASGESALADAEVTSQRLHELRDRCLRQGNSFTLSGEVRRVLTTYLGPESCPADLVVIGSEPARRVRAA